MAPWLRPSPAGRRRSRCCSRSVSIRGACWRFLAETAIIAAIGGIIGAILSLPINGIVASTTNWASFSEIAFAFRVTPALLLAGFVFAVVMGVVGGFFPARRAAKMQVVQALR